MKTTDAFCRVNRPGTWEKIKQIAIVIILIVRQTMCYGIFCVPRQTLTKKRSRATVSVKILKYTHLIGATRVMLKVKNQIPMMQSQREQIVR